MNKQIIYYLQKKWSYLSFISALIYATVLCLFFSRFLAFDFGSPCHSEGVGLVGLNNVGLWRLLRLTCRLFAEWVVVFGTGCSLPCFIGIHVHAGWDRPQVARRPVCEGQRPVVNPLEPSAGLQKRRDLFIFVCSRNVLSRVQIFFHCSSVRLEIAAFRRGCVVIPMMLILLTYASENIVFCTQMKNISHFTFLVKTLSFVRFGQPSTRIRIHFFWNHVPGWIKAKTALWVLC